ncbi:MAG: AAA family ATPase [Leptolyngbya sp. IPPAS B-1204]|nr:MAG: ATP-binding cassette family protein [Leptolyngbya sp. IPPAS B-1204]
MIPLQITLKNFLSYREACLDFRGLHVACICGANGAGKSSLLEAMAWAIWGESRALTEDDVIHLGATEALVDFSFACHQQTYRIIRSRHRGQVSTLEFQIQTPNGFRSLTERGIRATQQLILQHLKLDYETFINSAYLRQGRADEFMLKRPSERKQILADLLKLDQYDALAEQAKEQARQFKAELTMLERQLDSISTQLQQEATLAAQQDQLSASLQQMQHQQQIDAELLREFQIAQQQHQASLQQLALHQQQQQHLSQECQRLHQERLAAQQQQQQLEAILREADQITSHYTQLQQFQAEEESQTAKFQIYQTLQARKQQLQQQQAEQVHQLKDRLRQAQTRWEWLRQQQQDIQQTLAKTEDVEAGLEHLRQARLRLSELDQRQMQVAPLIQQRQQVQTQIDRQQARLTARLEELQSLRQQLEQQQQIQPQLQQAAITIAERIEYLERRRLYQQQVREKGMERRTFMERLHEQQRKCEREMAELDHKLLMLQQERVTAGEEHSGDEGIGNWRDGEMQGELQLERVERSVPQVVTLSSPLLEASSYPPCPLCSRPLDEQHWQLVLERHQQEKQEIQDQLWVIREQLTTSDREIRVLRQEYRELEHELAEYGKVLEQRGQLQEQIQGALQGHQRLQQVVTEQIELEQSLHHGDYAADLYEELRLLDDSLRQLNYDDRDHALVRGQVDRWRWAEIKQAEIRQAQRKQAQLAEQQPQLEATIAELQQQLDSLQSSPLRQALDHLDRQLLELDYNPDQHTQLRQVLRQFQPWQLRYQSLLQAEQHYPQLQQRLQELTDLWVNRSQLLEAMNTQIATLTQQLQQFPDPAAAIQTLEQQMQQRRAQLDQCLAQLGRLQQQQQQFAELQIQAVQFQTRQQTVRRQLRVYQELAQAFGKNGIQALMIENVLPQLEAETNQILGRLSANQLHVQFVTQRASRKTNLAATKMIDTLDILISDVQGTRPYETYSGGEAFRVNFAIRLALARLLAQRSGMALQLLIIDEGFGTQDDAGCDRLIGAINTIAADFACILTVTHIPHLKEAFQTRIEVCKTEQGSQLRLTA